MAFVIGLGATSHSTVRNGAAARAVNATTDEKKNPLSAIRFWGFLITGTIINYIIGTAVFCFSTGSGLSAGIAACVIPFIPTAVIKALIGGILGLRIRRAVS